MSGLYASATDTLPKGAVEGAIVGVVILGFLAIAFYQWGRLNAQMSRRVKELKKEVDDLNKKNRAA